MQEFNELLRILQRLLAPDGCPWDREQTLHSMRSSLLEEAAEVVEAINLNDNLLIEEELGDLFFNVLFLSLLAEKEQRCTLQSILTHISNKLVRRHPHVFGEAFVENSQAVLQQWDQLKALEKGDQRPSSLDGIPKELPTLMRAQKMYKRMKKAGHIPNVESTHPEMDVGASIFELITQTTENKIDAEQALRAFLTEQEQAFRKWEQQRDGAS